MPGDRLAAGAVVETGETELTMLSSDGTRLQVAAHSELRFTRADVIRWFRLPSQGAVSLAVAKLPPGQRFVVETPDRGRGEGDPVRGASGVVRRLRRPDHHPRHGRRGDGGRSRERRLEVIRTGAHWPAGCPGPWRAGLGRGVAAPGRAT